MPRIQSHMETRSPSGLVQPMPKKGMDNRIVTKHVCFMMMLFYAVDRADCQGKPPGGIKPPAR